MAFSRSRSCYFSRGQWLGLASAEVLSVCYGSACRRISTSTQDHMAHGNDTIKDRGNPTYLMVLIPARTHDLAPFTNPEG